MTLSGDAAIAIAVFAVAMSIVSVLASLYVARIAFQLRPSALKKEHTPEQPGPVPGPRGG